MSTKIHNGYAMPVMSLFDLNSTLEVFRAKAVEEASRLMRAKLVEHACEVIDFGTLDGKEVDRSKPLMVARDFVETKFKAVYATMHRDPSHDFGLSLTFLAIPGRTLALIYTEQKTLRDLWEATPFVEPYGYWNNTDRPRGVSAKAWKQREADWDAAMPSSCPARHGVTAEVVTTDLGWDFDPESFLPYVLPVRERIRERVQDEYFAGPYWDRWQAAHPDEVAASTKRPAGAIYMDALFDYRDWRKTDEGKATLAAEIERIAAGKKDTLTVEELRGW